MDSRLRTTNKRVFAAGDVAGGPQFTHVAGYHAGVVTKNALFRIPAKADHTSVPGVTYTGPELAQVGLTQAHAQDAYGNRIRVLIWRYADDDRARAACLTEGLIKAVTDTKGRVLGAGVIGASAQDTRALTVAPSGCLSTNS